VKRDLFLVVEGNVFALLDVDSDSSQEHALALSARTMSIQLKNLSQARQIIPSLTNHRLHVRQFLCIEACKRLCLLSCEKQKQQIAHHCCICWLGLSFCARVGWSELSSLVVALDCFGGGVCCFPKNISINVFGS